MIPGTQVHQEQQQRPDAQLKAGGWAPKCSEPPAHVSEVVTYLRDRGLAADDEDAIHLLTKLLASACRSTRSRISVSSAARALYMSRRSLGRRCFAAGMPAPSRILAFGRILEAARMLQSTPLSLSGVAEALGSADPFGLSNTMHRLTGIRPSDARERGLLYVAEAWLQRELMEGGAELRSPRPTPCPSCGQAITVSGRTDDPALSR